MRIETWNIKKGDPISVYTRDGGEYIGQTDGEIWEEDDQLYIHFTGRFITKYSVPAMQYKGIAVFCDLKYKWLLVGNTYK